MKVRDEVSPEKLRGGFYSPPSLVRFCLDRVREATRGASGLRVLEPSAGDGAFIRGLLDHSLSQDVGTFLGIELLAQEASKCRALATACRFDARVANTNALDWALESQQEFDVVVGNPPFVRFQFLSAEDRSLTSLLGLRVGLPFKGVSNLWQPVLVGALDRLRLGGVMAVILPAECFTGASAAEVRAWLSRNFPALRMDLFPPGSFPGVLQEIVVVSGARGNHNGAGRATRLRVTEHISDGTTLTWEHSVESEAPNWTPYLLTPSQLGAIAEAKSLPSVKSLGGVAKMEVSTVTGANEFFSVEPPNTRWLWVMALGKASLTASAPFRRAHLSTHRPCTNSGFRGQSMASPLCERACRPCGRTRRCDISA